MEDVLIRIFTTGLVMLEPAAPAEPPSEPPPIQRPRAVEQPSAPAPVESAPVTPAPVDPPAQPIELPTQVEPPTPTTAPAPAPAPATATPFDPSPPPPLPGSEEPPIADEPPPVKRIAPAFRRPGAWLASGVSLLAVGTILRFVFPVATKVHTRCAQSNDCPDHEMTGAGIAILIASIPVDAMTMISFGFAGRSYGLRSGKSSHRAPAIGSGTALVVAGFALQLAGLAVPLVRDRPDVYSYAVAGIREAAVVAASAGGFLIGYGVASPYASYAAAKPQRRFAIAPAFSRGYAGLAITMRR